MIETLHFNFINQKTNKRKMLSFMLTRDGSGERKMLKKIFALFERQNMWNKTISELYIDNNKWKYSSNSKEILKSTKNLHEKFCNIKTISKAATTGFLNKNS